MITYRQGDLLDSHCNVICHQVNCSGVMGAGIAKQIRIRYPQVYPTFMCTYHSRHNVLGNIDVVLSQDFDAPIEDGRHRRFIINMYAQQSYNSGRRRDNQTDYAAFAKCLQALKQELSDYIERSKRDKDAIHSFTIGFPYGIGCGLAGGNWSKVSAIIQKEFGGTDWNVEIWQL